MQTIMTNSYTETGSAKKKDDVLIPPSCVNFTPSVNSEFIFPEAH